MRVGVAVRNLPLPEPHLAILGAGIVLQAIRPLRLPAAGSRPALVVAGALAGAGVAVIGWATLAASRTDLAAPDRLVTSGPYILTRHPMYESWTALYAALAVILRNGWLALLLPGLLALVDREAAREERRLRARFGPAYAAYARRAPRYLPLWLVRWLRQPASR